MIKNTTQSKVIANLICGALLIVTVNSFDFATHQFTLWQGSIIPVGEYESVSTMVVLPAPYDSSYDRILALAGYSLNFGNSIDFQLWLYPISVDSIATVGLRTGASITIYEISAYIIFVNATSNWVWALSSSRLFTTIDNPVSGASQFFVISGPPIIDSLFYQIYAFIISYKAFTLTNGFVGVNINVASLTSPNSYNIVAQKGTSSALTRLDFSVLVINDTQLNSNKVINYNDLFTLYPSSPLTSPTNFGIPNQFDNSIFGGYDGGCLIGLTYFFWGGLSSPLQDHSIMFDAHSNPFTSVQNIIPSGQTCYSYYNIVCLIECPPGTTYSSGTCIPCLPNCEKCPNSLICQLCFSGFRPNIGNTSCLTCLNMTITCLDCINSTYCTVCINDTYGVSGNHLCESCSVMIANCASCTNYTFCSQCTNTGYYLAAGNQICLACSVTLPNCLNCSSASNCTVCINSSFYIGADRLCHLCSDSLLGCLECISINPFFRNCTRCADYYFITNTSQCKTCAVIPNCLNCTNSTYCLSCANSSLAFSVLDNSCLPCEQLFENCLSCTNFQCINCQEGLESLDGGQSCQCVVGNLIGGLCNTIIGCVQPVLLPDGSLSCLSCDPASFELSPINGICQCLSGSLISGVCSDNPGCLTTATAADGSQVCAFCNISAGFFGTPDSAGNCVCPAHFEMQGSTCADTCGDGCLMSSVQNACDDGNIESGDGCSSVCKVEVGFRCENGSSSTASNCVYVGIPLVLSLKRIERSDGLNQGVFQFTVAPPLVTLNRMDLSRYVTLDCDSTYTIADISYSAGTLKLTADYSADMEGLPCELTLSFDSGVIRSPNASLSFSSVSRNAPLIISHRLSEYGTIKLIFGYLALIALGLFVLSLPHKMIGAELLFNCQLVYLSNAFYARASFLFGSVKDFGLVSGYWSFFYDEAEHADLLYPFSERVQLTPFFLEDSLIVVGVLLLFVLLFIVFVVWRVFAQTNVKDERNQRQPENSLTVVVRTVYTFFLFPVAAGFSCVLTIAVYVNNLGLLGASHYQFSHFLNSASLFFAWLTLGIIAAIELLSFRCAEDGSVLRLRGLEGVKPWYIPTFIIREATVILLIKAGTVVSFDYIGFVLLAISLLYLVLILRTRPYGRMVDNIGLVACELASTYAILLPVLQKITVISESIELFLLLVLEGTLIIAALVALFRICLVYRDLISSCLLRKRAASRQKKMDERKCKRDYVEQEQILETSQMQRINPYRFGGNPSIIRGTNIEKLRCPNQRMEIANANTPEGDFDNELLSIKNRLRENLFQKVKRKKVIQPF